MTDPFSPINAFGGELDFKAAYKWGRDDIVKFLKNVSDNPGNYGVPDPTVRKPDLQLLYGYIEALKPPILNDQGQVTSPGGTRYQNPKPEQQILRKSTGITLDPTKKIPWAANSKSEEYFIVFDLIGVFLSLLGPAPSNATSKNYFLPLVVVYGRWCIAFTTGSGFAPTVAQITWATKSDGKTYPFLGASAKGFAYFRGWPNLVKRRRHGLLSGILQSPYTEYGTAPELREDRNGRIAGWNFGNCGETYPFLYVVADTTLKNSSSGIALNIANCANNPTKLPTEHPNVYDGQKYWKRGPIKPPCLNCEQLLTWYQAIARLPYYKLYENPA